MLGSGAYFRDHIRHMIMNETPHPPETLITVLNRHGPAVRQEFEPVCRRHGMQWPPARIQMLAFKQERKLEVWGADRDGPFNRLAAFPIMDASGGPGPKLRSGDRQVPEGFYRLTNLNPQSTFHLSIRVDFPNEEDVRNATVERRLMGDDIYVHGGAASVGCLAMGDEAIEKIFCLTAQSDPNERHILISPTDFRGKTNSPPADQEPWVVDLYSRISKALSSFPL